ncbi:MAG: hypothetical protein AAF226_15210 [Verrucomicrobiota bacterium]
MYLVDEGDCEIDLEDAVGNQSDFSSWSLQRLEDFFGLERTSDHPELWKWISDPPKASAEDHEDIEELRQLLDRHALGWNEEELKFHFLGPTLSDCKFRGRQF